MNKSYCIQDLVALTEIVSIPLVSDKRRASSGENVEYEHALLFLFH